MSKPTVAVARLRLRNNSPKPCHQGVRSRVGENEGFLMIPSSSIWARSEIQMRSGGAISEGILRATSTMLVRSATKLRHSRHSTKCDCTACGSGARPSCSTTASTSLHCMTLHSEQDRHWTAALSSSVETFQRNQAWFRLEPGSTPTHCAHCSSIIVRRLRFRGMSFLPSLLAYFFLEQLTESRSRLVQLRLRVPHRASHDIRDLVVLVSLDVVQHEHRPVTGRQSLDGLFQVHPLDRGAESQIGSPNVCPGAACFLVRLGGVFQ